MTEKHYIGEIGTEILLDTGVTISGATNTKIKCRKPDGTEIEWTATVKNTTKLSYVIQSGDFSVAGTYRIQASLSLSGWTGLGETASFVVNNLYEG